MEYTVDKLARLGGVSPRTLRYYDQIGLLRPARVTSAGYRVYGEAEVNRLQQILFCRELGMGLAQITQTIGRSGFDRLAALRSHLRALEAQRERTEQLIKTLRKTIQKEMGKATMTDKEKFEGFKKGMIQENEERYGQEIKEKYGEEKVRRSNAKMMGLSMEEFAEMEDLAEAIRAGLEKAVAEGLSPKEEEGRKLAEMHKAWLCYVWPEYNAEAHRGVGDLYVADERFTAYYDRATAGCAAFLRDAIHAHIG